MRLAIVGFAEPLVEEQIGQEVADARASGDIDIVRVASFVPVAVVATTGSSPVPTRVQTTLTNASPAHHESSPPLFLLNAQFLI